MTPSDGFSRHQLLLLRTAAAVARQRGEWPTYHHVLSQLLNRGVQNPDVCVDDLRPDYLVADRDLDLGSRVKLTAQGWDAAFPDSLEIHSGFVMAIRGCYDRFKGAKPQTPTVASAVSASALDLLPDATHERRRVVGLLLDSEGVGEVTWTGERSSPWSIYLMPQILDFASVGSFPDYLDAKTTPALAIVSSIPSMLTVTPSPLSKEIPLASTSPAR